MLQAIVTWNFNLTEISYEVKQEVSKFMGQAGSQGDEWGNFQDTQEGKKLKALGTMSNVFKRSCDIENMLTELKKKTVTDLFIDKKTVQTNL